ncbi:hypothetical protein BGZ91_009102, partial [Linnemannia elongata]
MQYTPFLLPPPPRRHAVPVTVPRNLQLEISGIPAENGKCRVETQLKIGLHLRSGNSNPVT